MKTVTWHIDTISFTSKALRKINFKILSVQNIKLVEKNPGAKISTL
jgi:hypothetical protein